MSPASSPSGRSGRESRSASRLFPPRPSRSSWRSCTSQTRPTGTTSRPPGLSCATSAGGHFFGRGRHEDDVERRLVGPAEVAVAAPDGDVGVPEAPESGRGRLGQRVDQLHAEHTAPPGARAPRPGTRTPCRLPARGPTVTDARAPSSTPRCRVARWSGRGRWGGASRRRRLRGQSAARTRGAARRAWRRAPARPSRRARRSARRPSRGAPARTRPASGSPDVQSAGAIDATISQPATMNAKSALCHQL